MGVTRTALAIESFAAFVCGTLAIAAVLRGDNSVISNYVPLAEAMGVDHAVSSALWPIAGALVAVLVAAMLLRYTTALIAWITASAGVASIFVAASVEYTYSAITLRPLFTLAAGVLVGAVVAATTVCESKLPLTAVAVGVFGTTLLWRLRPDLEQRFGHTYLPFDEPIDPPLIILLVAALAAIAATLMAWRIGAPTAPRAPWRTTQVLIGVAAAYTVLAAVVTGTGWHSSQVASALVAALTLAVTIAAGWWATRHNDFATARMLLALYVVTVGAISAGRGFLLVSAPGWGWALALIVLAAAACWGLRSGDAAVPLTAALAVVVAVTALFTAASRVAFSGPLLALLLCVVAAGSGYALGATFSGAHPVGVAVGVAMPLWFMAPMTFLGGGSFAVHFMGESFTPVVPLGGITPNGGGWVLPLLAALAVAALLILGRKRTI